MEQWAEIGRMKHVERLSQREIQRRTGIHRDTIRRALASPEPPSYGPRPRRPSKLDPFPPRIEELLDDEPFLSSVRILEEIAEAGYSGGKTILDDLLRELRPRFLPPPRSFQRTVYRPGELAQFDLCAPKTEIPVGWGQTRRGYVVSCNLSYSRAFADALVFSKEFADIGWGMSRCLDRLGALPKKLVWDRDGAIAPRGRPTEPLLAFCGAALARLDHPRRRRLPGQGRARARPPLPGRQLRGRPALCQPARLPGPARRLCDRVNRRKHRTTWAVLSERLATERERMRELPATMPDSDRRFVVRVSPQPYLRFDRNDYSLDPQLVGRRVEVRASQAQITAVSLDTGVIAARHRRAFAGGLCCTDPAHQRALDELRGERRRPKQPQVEARPLAHYDALIPA